MAVHEGFLQAILESPGDDMVRLVYADWLEDNGESERAEFIRVQIQLAQLGEDDPRRPALQEQARFLAYNRFQEWRAAAVPGVEVERFERGFAAELKLSAANFLHHADALFTSTPVTALRLHGIHGLMGQLAACPHLAHLTGLDLSLTHLTANDFIALLESPHLRALQHLSVAGNDLPIHVIEVLADTRNLENLIALDMGGNDIGDDGAAALTAFPGLFGLERLLMWNAAGYYSQAIHARGAMALARSGALGHLRHLNLNGHQIGDGGLRELAHSEELSGLRHLGLQGNGIGEIGDAGMEALALSPFLTQLRHLDLWGNEIAVGGGRTLAMWPGLAEVRWLGLEKCKLGDSGVRALAESVYAGGLHELKLGKNRITDRGARALLESPYLSDGIRMDLNGNAITLELREALSERFRIDFD